MTTTATKPAAPLRSSAMIASIADAGVTHHPGAVRPRPERAGGRRTTGSSA